MIFGFSHTYTLRIKLITFSLTNYKVINFNTSLYFSVLQKSFEFSFVIQNLSFNAINSVGSKVGVASITQSATSFKVSMTAYDGNTSSTSTYYTYLGQNLSQINDVFNNVIVLGNMVTTAVMSTTKISGGAKYVSLQNVSTYDDEFASGLNSIFTFKGSFKVAIHIYSFCTSNPFTLRIAHLTCDNGVASWTFSPGTSSSSENVVGNSSNVMTCYCKVDLDTFESL